MKVALGSITERAPAGRLFEAIATLTDLPFTPARRESLAENAVPDTRKVKHRAGAR
jgi:hypothetical protein